MQIVLHIDMDAFFAAVEERVNPELKGKPIVIGADPKSGKGRGVVSTASYAARKYGIRSALPISKAWQLSEEARKRGELAAVFLPVDGELYGETSKRIMEYLRPLGSAFEQASVDEVYLEPKFSIFNFQFSNKSKIQKSPHQSKLGTGQAKFKIDPWEEARKFAEKIKRDIKEREGLTCSIGIGPNKLVAKIASDLKKPDGLTLVRPEDVQKIFDPLSIRVIPGIGPKTEIALNKRGIKTIADLRMLARAELVETFGKWGSDLYRKARGESDDPVSDEWVAKSIGEQETFEKDTLRAAFLMPKMDELCTRVFTRFQKSEFSSFRTIAITVRFKGFETKTRAHTLAKPAATLKALKTEALKLMLPFLDTRENPKKKPIRLLGVRVEKLM